MGLGMTYRILFLIFANNISCDIFRCTFPSKYWQTTKVLQWGLEWRTEYYFSSLPTIFCVIYSAVPYRQNIYKLLSPSMGLGMTYRILFFIFANNILCDIFCCTFPSKYWQTLRSFNGAWNDVPNIMCHLCQQYFVWYIPLYLPVKILTNY